MSKKTIRALASVLVIGTAFVVLLVVTMRGNAQYYKHVDEVMPHAAEWYGKGLQLHGFVVDGSICARPDTLDYQFKVKNGDRWSLASYTGVVPDTFKDGAEVVLKGTLGPDGFHVEPNGVMAKCPVEVQAGRPPVERARSRPALANGAHYGSLGSFSCWRRSCWRAARSRRHWRARGGGRPTLIKGGIGLFHVVTALHARRVRGHDPRLGRSATISISTSSTIRIPPSRCSTSSRPTGAGSTGR